MNESHQAEMDRLQETYGKQIQDVNDKSRQSVSVREMRHQKKQKICAISIANKHSRKFKLQMRSTRPLKKQLLGIRLT
ncbi:MAG: hypothetical protein IPK68_21615 [Bdellovibrionales bacterium]|nr:hypothetical protein [Bdellovibrionales bacterium]